MATIESEAEIHGPSSTSTDIIETTERKAALGAFNRPVEPEQAWPISDRPEEEFVDIAPSLEASPAGTPKSEEKKSGKAGASKQAPTDRNESDELRLVADRLLACIEMPTLALDCHLVPPPLLNALSAARLDSTECLASAVVPFFAMTGPLAGPRVTVAPFGDEAERILGTTRGTSIRLCHIVRNRDLPVISPLLLGAAHAVSNELIDRYQIAASVAEAKRCQAAERRNAHAAATKLAIELGHQPPPPFWRTPPMPLSPSRA